jgi:hypothetical protein
LCPRCFSTLSRETQTSNNPIKIKAQGNIFIIYNKKEIRLLPISIPDGIPKKYE